MLEQNRYDSLVVFEAADESWKLVLTPSVEYALWHSKCWVSNSKEVRIGHIRGHNIVVCKMKRML